MSRREKKKTLLRTQPAVTDYTTHAAQPSICPLHGSLYVPGFPDSNYFYCHLKMY